MTEHGPKVFLASIDSFPSSFQKKQGRDGIVALHVLVKRFAETASTYIQ
jgi:hypothetical protein